MEMHAAVSNARACCAACATPESVSRAIILRAHLIVDVERRRARAWLDVVRTIANDRLNSITLQDARGVQGVRQIMEHRQRRDPAVPKELPA
jgi:hypothetical protein